MYSLLYSSLDQKPGVNVTGGIIKIHEYSHHLMDASVKIKFHFFEFDYDERDDMIAQIEKILKYCVLGLLALFALATLFVFVINWETWFFGIKLDGLPAGSPLVQPGLRRPCLQQHLSSSQRDRLIGGLAVIYFGFLFVNSSIKIQRGCVQSPGFFTRPRRIPPHFNCILHYRCNKRTSGEPQNTPVKRPVSARTGNTSFYRPICQNTPKLSPI